jgi:hypothetical protein
MKIEKVEAIEILDSRSVPTVEVNLEPEDGTVARAMVPKALPRENAKPPNYAMATKTVTVEKVF